MRTLRTSSQGNSMIETLVSLVLLSFGSLGAASLQVTSQQSSHEAQQRMLASYLAQDMLERMRNNPTALTNYASTAVGSNTIATEPTPSCSATASCTTIQLAAHDRWLWEQAIDGVAIKTGSTKNGGLVAAKGCVTNNNGRVQIAIAWNDTETIADAGTASNGVSTCGAASAYRRQVVINSFIN